MYMYFCVLFVYIIYLDDKEGLQNYHENRKVNYRNV